MTKSRGIILNRRYWTAEEDAILRARYPDTPTKDLLSLVGRTYASVTARAATLGLEKSQAYLASPAACRLRRGDNVGAAYRFRKGQTPPNKGLHRPGYSVGRGRMQETQFKRNEMMGRAADLYKPIGTERISKDGYLERKTHDALPEGLSRQEANRLRARRWKAVHLIVWEAAHGPLPKGHAIAFKNGDKRDIRLDNLELLTRGQLMARNTIHNLPLPLKSTINLLGQLKRRIREKSEKRHGETHDS